ncbi:hypothetical protein JD844_011084 [Phrynosoma platyrhinos]|uniref:Uncharacterized protein n=1 Tax=Phrynosoma platyrhinos TaxID=52577 RepID=A0ABQ7TIN4_PHRPL|nr:hypothetical protein JD844_011084 [Phrynosoma platyrhinos]
MGPGSDPSLSLPQSIPLEPRVRKRNPWTQTPPDPEVSLPGSRKSGPREAAEGYCERGKRGPSQFLLYKMLCLCIASILALR